MSEFFPVAFVSFPDAPASHKFRTHVENNAGMGAFVCHWEDQPAGHSILHLAAVDDGASTVAPVGTLARPIHEGRL